jgi:multidrug efflux system membrane fusion protein
MTAPYSKSTLLALGLTGILATTALYLPWPGNPAYAGEANTQATIPGLPVVETVTVEETGLRSWATYSGRLQAINQSAIRPLVSGTVQQVLFEDGSWVEQGQSLFVIDPRPFENALAHAEAALASAASDADLAEVEYERAEALVKNQTISQSQRDERENNLKVARARVASAEAEVASARLDLEYAHVKAPISGRIGRAEVTEGNVVEAGANAPVLASIVGTDRLYAEFDVDEQTYFKVQRSVIGANNVVPVELALGDEQGTVYRGQLHAFDNQLDIASGTIRARAIVANSDGSLIPGAFASVKLGTASEIPQLLVPERAVMVSQDKRYVYIVNGDDRVEYREVTLGESIDSRRIVTNGLNKGERVIVNGLQRVTTDMQVETVTTDASASADIAAVY